MRRQFRAAGLERATTCGERDGIGADNLSKGNLSNRMPSGFWGSLLQKCRRQTGCDRNKIV